MHSFIFQIPRFDPSAEDIVASARELPHIKTNAGRSRVWFRLALMQKKLADYFKVWKLFLFRIFSNTPPPPGVQILAPCSISVFLLTLCIFQCFIRLIGRKKWFLECMNIFVKRVLKYIKTCLLLSILFNFPPQIIRNLPFPPLQTLSSLFINFSLLKIQLNSAFQI